MLDDDTRLTVHGYVLFFMLLQYITWVCSAVSLSRCSVSTCCSPTIHAMHATAVGFD